MALRTIYSFQGLLSESLFSFRLFQREGEHRNIEPKMKVKLKSSNGKRLSAQIIRQTFITSDERIIDVPTGKIPLPRKKTPFTKTCKKRISTKKKKDGKNFRKSVRSQSLPECNSSGSDLETHFAPQTKDSK